MPTTLFFAGTDTDVGKTYTAGLVAKWLVGQGKRVGVYKPVASGCQDVDGQRIAEDATALWEAAGCPLTLNDVCPQKFLAPLAPNTAAAQENTTVDSKLLRAGARCWESNFDVLIVEGAGGLMSPLADGFLNIELAKQFECQLIIVAANRLGVIHQTLATCAAAEHLSLKPSAIFLCQVNREPDGSTQTNAEQISKYTDIPILGSVSYQGQSDQVARIEEMLAIKRRPEQGA